MHPYIPDCGTVGISKLYALSLEFADVMVQADVEDGD